MNRIILIGNGFDLAHGLETSYRHFIDNFWKNLANDFNTRCPVRNFNNDFLSINASLISPESRFLDYQSFRDWLKDYKIKITFKNRFLGKISEKSAFKNWVDIEEEYYQQIKNILNPPKVYDSHDYRGDNEKGIDIIIELNEDFKRIKQELKKYLLDEQNAANNKSNPRTIMRIKEKIYSNFDVKDFNEAGKNAVEKENINQPKEILFLNFNYTNTEAFYSGRNTYIHIHGDLEYPQNPIIFGYGDELADEYKEIEKINNNCFLENIKSIKYLETDNYKRLLNFINSDNYQIFIMGHSCGISDRTLLNTLFEHPHCVSIKTFYHKRDDGTDDYGDVTKNMSRNFTDKPMMREKVVNKTYCEPLL